MCSIQQELDGWRHPGLVKKIVTLFEIAPQSNVILVPAVSVYQFGISCIGQPRGEDGQADLFLSGVVGLHTIDIEFPDPVISHGKTSRRDTGTVNEDIVSQMSANTPDTVGGIRIINLHRQIVFAEGIHP